MHYITQSLKQHCDIGIIFSANFQQMKWKLRKAKQHYQFILKYG